MLLQALAAAPSSQAASQATALPPLSLCIERLSRSKDQLDAISSALQALGDGSRAEGTTATPGAYRDLQRKLHEGELGRFWATARLVCQRSLDDMGSWPGLEFFASHCNAPPPPPPPPPPPRLRGEHSHAHTHIARLHHRHPDSRAHPSEPRGHGWHRRPDVTESTQKR